MIWNDKPIVIKLDKLGTTPTDFTKIAKECDVKSLKKVSQYLKKKKEIIKSE